MTQARSTCALAATLGVLGMFPLAAAPTERLPTRVSAPDGHLALRYPGRREVSVAGVQGASDPALSPNRHFAAYILAAPGAKISTGLGDADPNQVWLLDTATLNTTRLVVSRESDDIKQVLGGLSHPVFSADGRQVFFLSAAWATSDAVHAVDIQTHRVCFVTDGSTLRVISKGRCRGDLVVNKHKYRPNEGGAYDADWLVSPSGREIKMWIAGASAEAPGPVTVPSRMSVSVSVSGRRLVMRYGGHRKTYRLTQGIYSLVLSPNGRQAVYIMEKPYYPHSVNITDAAPNSLWLLDAATGKNTKIAETSKSAQGK